MSFVHLNHSLYSANDNIVVLRHHRGMWMPILQEIAWESSLNMHVFLTVLYSLLIQA